ncbi:hypothetical protein [Bacillus infantis]|uniref:hypothetical protein n=1 Tax=Bacillus infantis TaxID=324767 RepID=UPI003CFA8813
MNQEIKYNNATVRIHGTADNDKIRKAATDFLKKVEFQRKEVNENGKRKVAN